VNSTDDIKESFQPYYETTILSEATDPNILHDLERDILAFRLFSHADTEKFAGLLLEVPPAEPKQIHAFLDPFVVRFGELLNEEQEDLRAKIRDYTRRYSFLAQVVPFEDVKLARLYHFCRYFLRKLPVKKQEMPFEVLSAIDMSSYGVKKTSETSITLEREAGVLEPLMSSKLAPPPADEREALSRIIQEMNDRFAGDISPEDAILIRDNLSTRLSVDSELGEVLRENPADAARIVFAEAYNAARVKMYAENDAFFLKLANNPEMNQWLQERLFELFWRRSQENGDKK
jgi:type I restriction enzyme, R subunit